MSVLGYKTSVVRRRSAPHCWKAKACNLTLLWCDTDRLQMLQQIDVSHGSEKSVKKAPLNGHSRNVYIISRIGASMESQTVGFEELVSILCMFYIWSFLQTSCRLGLWSEGPWASQSAWDRPGAWSCSFASSETHSHTVGLLCNVNLGMVNR